MNTESLRTNQSTAARHNHNSMSDVTRLVATEQLRNKHSLRESILLHKVTLRTAQISIKAPLQTALFAINPNICTEKVNLYLITK